MEIIKFYVEETHAGVRIDRYLSEIMEDYSALTFRNC